MQGACVELATHGTARNLVDTTLESATHDCLSDAVRACRASLMVQAVDGRAPAPAPAEAPPAPVEERVCAPAQAPASAKAPTPAPAEELAPAEAGSGEAGSGLRRPVVFHVRPDDQAYALQDPD